MVNALTIDVEDYFHVSAFEACVARNTWEEYPVRAVDSTKRALDMLDEHGRKATFFVLGWLAERYPELVRDIHGRGHEVASHGYGHQRIYCLEPEDFRQDSARAKALLEDAIGAPVCGYRAPSYSITRKSLWALDILIEQGFEYDSSIFPVVHDTYGIPDFPRTPVTIRRPGGTITEVPLTTLNVTVAGKRLNLPVAGGGYMRLMPGWLMVKALKHVMESDNIPAVVYLHPWELDPEQPRVEGAPLKSRFRHYLNLSSTESKLDKLLHTFPFGRMDDMLAATPPTGTIDL